MRLSFDHSFFHRPTRVSRLFPVLFVVSAIASSGFFYYWQLNKLNANTVIQTQNGQIATLQQQVATLTAQQKNDQSTLAAETQHLKDTSTNLTKVEQQLATSTAALKDKEAALADAQTKLKQQQDQISSNATELEQLRSRPPLFSFQNESSLSDITGTENQVKEVATAAYDYIVEIYGKPYLLNQITITFVDQFSIQGSAGEIVIENSDKGISINIHMKSFDKTNFSDVNVLIHEMIHGFHGVAVLDDSALEEGMTVAATDAVMERMIADGKLPAFSHLYLVLTPDQYALWNSTLVIPKDSSDFYKSADISKIYQLIGKAWFNLYRANPDFFAQLNAAYYPKVQQGNSPSTDLILSLIKTIVPKVSGTAIDTYLQNQLAFHPS